MDYSLWGCKELDRTEAHVLWRLAFPYPTGETWKVMCLDILSILRCILILDEGAVPASR